MLAEPIQTLTTALAGRYRVERVVGSGGMATVYVADDLRHNRKVAIKVLRPDIVAVLGKERFFREIELTAGLQHPHILPLFDSGSVTVDGNDDLLYYVMPYVDGESLRDRLRREQQLPIEDALRIAREVAGALTYASSRGIVHRDIKPENILLTQEFVSPSGEREIHAVLTDFGIARAVAETGGDRLTKAGTTLGTPPYMSPEQASGDKPVDARADVYALACVLFEMLAGEPPFTGPTAQSILVKHLTEPVPELRRRRDSVPEHVNVAITRALAKLPADRFTSARHFVDALDGGRVAVPGQKESRPWLRRGPVVAGALVVVAAVAALMATDVGGLRTRLTGSQTPVAPVLGDGRQSIAVLPFDNVGGNPAEEYFSDGLTEELIAALSELRSLRVAARTSAFAFKNQARDVRQIARALNVSSVLVGSVRKAQDRIRVTAQLIDANTGLDLWSQTYDERALAQVFDVQADIARRIAAALEASLTPAEQRRLVAKPTENLDAYVLYLKGRYYFGKRGAQLDTAINYFKQAIAIDPGYARAYAGLAASYGPQGVHGYIHPDKGRANMGSAARRAVALDDGLAEAHTVLAAYLSVYEWNWDAAEREFRRALELDRNFPTAHEWYGYMLENLGRFDEAISERWLARSLDPLVPGPGPASALILAGRYDSAKTVARDVVALDPTYWQAHWRLGDALAMTGDLSGAAAAYERAIVTSSGAAEPPAALARVLARSGKMGSAREIVAEIQRKSARTGIKHPDVAAALFAVGDTSAAFDWLEAALRQRHPAMPTLLVGTAFADMRPDPRFQDLVRRVGFPSTRR
jgi:serine/threonine-protein kinase